ncbi:ARM repeat-containing protein [Sistotremastrum suecicum HHB10207 ss-3]|uniref:ARM repeat-containing protein n=1 Tax=Sistotremastrum suecicum HHB10207 ss-3 TaxID=1314776 RepID=A0A166DE21_9AGAM|nr:ARM repeat-containing protein [Sistotremastrum suecicum HHB10207 ss-3]
MSIDVPPEVLRELPQILSNLIAVDNDIRSNAEKAVNERLAQAPEAYLLGLATFAKDAATEVMRTFTLVLLRRFLFRAIPNSPSDHSQSRNTLYDHLPENTRIALERLLLSCLTHETAEGVRRKVADTCCDMANGSFQRGRPWDALGAWVEGACARGDPGQRESAFTILANVPALLHEVSLATLLPLLHSGLTDQHSIAVRHAALRAAAAFLTSTDVHVQSQAVSLMNSILGTLPILPIAELPKFLSTITALAGSQPTLFSTHLSDLLTFLPQLLLPTPTDPTTARPSETQTPTASTSFTFPPVASRHDEMDHDEEISEEKDEARKAVLEFMISLSEARPGMIRRSGAVGEAWVRSVVRGCLEGMGEIGGSEAAWESADPSSDPTSISYPTLYEQSLDRLALALGGDIVLPVAFTYIPAMLVSADWKVRHAGLMGVACCAEGGRGEMGREGGKVIELVLPTFNDPHPRVRWAAAQCIGQLCTDLEELIQELHYEEILNVLIRSLEAPEPRVHAHAAAALINFCETVTPSTLQPYLDPVITRLLHLLQTSPHTYVQEQAITTLAMVADASESAFGKHYSTIMPLLLRVLETGRSAERKRVRCKAMECAGLIAIAVGRDVFRPDSLRLIQSLTRIQNGPIDPDDVMLTHYLIATWAKICQVMGLEFEPCLPIAIPPLLRSAALKADVSVVDADDDHANGEKEGWETIEMEGQQIGIKTSVIEEKCQAFEMLVIHVSTLNAKFAPYLNQSLELVLPSLRFFFHDGVREACALLVPLLLSCAKASGNLSQEIFTTVFTQLINVTGAEPDSSYLASLYKCITDSTRVVGPSNIPAVFVDGILKATQNQLTTIAHKRRARASMPARQLAEEREDIALIEEMEDFALEDMAKLVGMLDKNHPLLVAISSVKELAVVGPDSGSGSEWE